MVCASGEEMLHLIDEKLDTIEFELWNDFLCVYLCYYYW